MRITPLAGLLTVGLLGASVSARAEELKKDWRFSSSLNYESGTYGTGTRSSFLYVPFTLKRAFGDAFASVTVPFVSQTTDGGVNNIGGRPVRTGRGRGTGRTTTQSGLGDVIGRAGYDLLVEDPAPIDLAVVAKVKIPTAQRSKGLGTGEFDAGGGLEAAKTVAPGWTVLADVYFTAIGDPPGVDLNNQFAADAGVAYLFQPGLTGTILVEGSNSIFPGAPAPVDTRAMLDYKVDESISVNGGVLLGLSEGASDYGFSVGGAVRF